MTPSRPHEDLGVLALIRSDYERYCAFMPESRRTSLLKAPLRMLINTTLRAQVLIRLTCASPRWLHWFWRSVLITLHSSEVVYGARIGPRLHLPHPFGIGIGGQVTIGSDATICQHVTLGSDMRATGQPQVGSHVTLLAGAMLVGPIRVGDAAVVGANCVLEEDLSERGVAAPARARVVNRPVAARPVETAREAGA